MATRRLPLSLNRFKEVVSLVKDGAQILALVGVGLWTLFVYLRTEGPLAAGQIAADASIRSAPLADGRCEVAFGITIANNGRTTLRIDRLRIQATNLLIAPNDTAVLIDVETLKGRERIVERAIDRSSLMGDKRPGESANDWFFLVLPKGQHQRILVDATITGVVGGLLFDTPRELNAYGWTTPCAPDQTDTKGAP